MKVDESVLLEVQTLHVKDIGRIFMEKYQIIWVREMEYLINGRKYVTSIRTLILNALVLRCK